MRPLNFQNIIIVLGVFGFIFIVTALTVVQTNYNSAHQLISELALGKYGFFMMFAFFSFSIAVIMAQDALAIHSNNKIIRFLLFTSSCSLAGAGIFELGDYTNLHVILMAIAFVFIVLSMYLMPRLMPKFRKIKPTTICWFLGIGTVVSVFLGHEYIPLGVAQRVAASFIFLWLLWLAAFNQKQKSEEKC